MTKKFYKTDANNVRYLVLKPDVGKIGLKNATNIIVSVLLILGAVYLFDYTVGFEVIFEFLDMFNIEIDTSRLAMFFSIAVIGLAVLAFLGSYLISGLTKYEIYPDKIKRYKNVALLFIQCKEIKFEQVSKVLYNRDGIFNTMLKCGSIVIQMGSEQNTQVLEFIDDVETNFKDVDLTVRQFFARKMAEYSETQIFGNISQQEVARKTATYQQQAQQQYYRQANARRGGRR